jgi:guanylate kinase
VGKSTVLAQVMDARKDLRFSVSATTRDIRDGEVDGESYYFISKEQFEEMIRQNELLEHAQYVENYYGTPEAPLQQAMDHGVDCLLDIEPQGALQVRAKRDDAVLIFLAPPSLEILEARLRGRGDTPPDKIEKRLQQARWELEQAEKYDYIVINDSVDKAAGELLAIFTAEKCRAKDRIYLLKEEK